MTNQTFCFPENLGVMVALLAVITSPQVKPWQSEVLCWISLYLPIVDKIIVVSLTHLNNSWVLSAQNICSCCCCCCSWHSEVGCPSLKFSWFKLLEWLAIKEECHVSSTSVGVLKFCSRLAGGFSFEVMFVLFSVQISIFVGQMVIQSWVTFFKISLEF